MSRTIYVTRSQNLAALIDNAYGHLTSREGSGLMRAIDDAEKHGEDPRRSAIAYLHDIGITVRTTDGDPRLRRKAFRPSRDPSFAWEVWSRGDGYDEPQFVEAFADKGAAQARIKRLQAGQRRAGMRPYSYMLKHRKVRAAQTFGTRGHRRALERRARRRS